MNKKLLGIILLVVGAVLLTWGYNVSESLSSQLSSAFNGAPSNKVMILYIGGGICTVLGILRLLK